MQITFLFNYPTKVYTNKESIKYRVKKAEEKIYDAKTENIYFFNPGG